MRERWSLMNGGEVVIALTSSADGDNDAGTSVISKRQLLKTIRTSSAV